MQSKIRSGSRYKVQKMDCETGYLIHRDEDQNYLAHYGVKGQRWGVITKEYEPVSVDHRKTRRFAPIANARARFAEKRAREEAEFQRERQAERENWKAIFEKRRARRRVVGTAIGAGLLGFALGRGYKINKIKGIQFADGKKALDSLLKLIPKKGHTRQALSRLTTSAFNLMQAKEASRYMGMSRVKNILSRSGSILTGRRYRDKIKKARDLIRRYRNGGFD